MGGCESWYRKWCSVAEQWRKGHTARTILTDHYSLGKGCLAPRGLCLKTKAFLVLISISSGILNLSSKELADVFFWGGGVSWVCFRICEERSIGQMMGSRNVAGRVNKARGKQREGVRGCVCV